MENLGLHVYKHWKFINTAGCELLLIPPATKLWGVYWNQLVRVCVHACVCACVRRVNLVEATLPTVFDGGLSNFAQLLDMMCRCAWRQKFWIVQVLTELCPLVFPCIYAIRSKYMRILVEATPLTVLNGWLSNFAQWLIMMCRCAWRWEFWIVKVLSELRPFVFPYILYIQLKVFQLYLKKVFIGIS